MSGTHIPTDQIAAAAMAAIPGYDAATAAAVQGQKWLMEHKAAKLAVPEAESELQAAAEAGDAFPVGLGARIAEARTAIAAHLNETNELENFVRFAKERQRSTAEVGADTALEFLDDLLLDLVDEVRENEVKFRKLPTASQIVASGDAAALKAHGYLRDLTARYLAIREAQAAVVRLALASIVDDNGRNQLLRGGQLADAVDKEDYYTARRAYAWSEREEDFGRVLLPWRAAAVEPALHAVSWRAPLPNDPEAQTQAVLEACTRAKPWVPSIKTMVEAARLADHATGVPDRSGESEHINALHDLETLTGHKSPHTPKPVNPRPLPPKPSRQMQAALVRERLHGR